MGMVLRPTARPTRSPTTASRTGAFSRRCTAAQWYKVLPYCIFNVLLMLALEFTDQKEDGWKKYIEISSQGHSFITLVVAFLLVSRVNMGLARYNSARDSLGCMYRNTREVIQNMCVFSSHDHNAAAVEWRHEVAYRCLILLRTAMSVIDFPEDHITPWDIPELNGMELEDVKNNIFLSANNRRWAHGERTVWEEAMRVPIRIAYLLRKSVHAQNKMLKEPIVAGQENKMLASVDSFMSGYYSIRKFLTTVRLGVHRALIVGVLGWCLPGPIVLLALVRHRSSSHTRIIPPISLAPLLVCLCIHHVRTARALSADSNGSHLFVSLRLYRPLCDGFGRKQQNRPLLYRLSAHVRLCRSRNGTYDPKVMDGWMVARIQCRLYLGSVLHLHIRFFRLVLYFRWRSNWTIRLVTIRMISTTGTTCRTNVCSSLQLNQ